MAAIFSLFLWERAGVRVPWNAAAPKPVTNSKRTQPVNSAAKAAIRGSTGPLEQYEKLTAPSARGHDQNWLAAPLPIPTTNPATCLLWRSEKSPSNPA
jgi:hypothetical protein